MRYLVKVLLLLLIIIFFLGLLSCQNDICKLPNGEKTTDLLASVVHNRNYNYCKLLEQSLNEDSNAIKSLALLNFSDAAGYDHGAVLVEVIFKIGEKTFINAIECISKEQKAAIEGYLSVGLEYGYRKECENKTVKQVFPDVYSFLNK